MHDDARLAWAASGGMWLTGWPGEAPLGPPGPILEQAAQARNELAIWSQTWSSVPSPFLPLDVTRLLFGRAALTGLGRRGQVSANGTCRLLRAADGWLAVSLARPDDEEAVPAITGDDVAGDAWDALQRVAAVTGAAQLVERAQLLGVPAAVLPAAPQEARPWPVRWTPGRGTWPGCRRPVVIDTSAMWAGPLCGRLLAAAGAEVTKVEFSGRPDGARFGYRGFWEWLHQGQPCVTIDPQTAEGLSRLDHLISGADAVIASARPRAFDQLGIAFRRLAESGLTWVSITGYGVAAPGSALVAFGDDAAVGGGLVGRDRRGDPVFCGDAIADPLSGLVAAAAAARALAGGGGLVDVAMAEVAAWAVAPVFDRQPDLEQGDDGAWRVIVGESVQPVRPPVRPDPLP